MGIADLRVLFLKENVSFDHDYDPWNRKMRSWQFLDTDGHLLFNVKHGQRKWQTKWFP